jgi:hypothetical protein
MPAPQSHARTTARTPKRPAQPCQNILRLQTLDDPGVPHRGIMPVIEDQITAFRRHNA